MSYYSSRSRSRRSGAVAKIAVVCLVFTKWAPLIVGDDDKTPSDSQSKKQVIASHCSDKCGDIQVPYPFGIEEGCYYEEKRNNQVKNYTSNFKISCNESRTPILGTNLELLNIKIGEGEIRIKNLVAHKCYNQTGLITRSNWIATNFASFTLSNTKNELVAVGCNTYAWFEGWRTDDKYFSTGCMTTCRDKNDVVEGECSGIGCCQISFPTSSRYIYINVKSWNNQNKSWVYEFNPCSVAFAVEKQAFRFNQKYLSQGVDAMTLPVVVDWAIGPNNCSHAKAHQNCLCNGNADCHDSHNGLGYSCKCKPGFEGNPYLPHGCIDIDECKLANKCQNKDYCFNTEGSYGCRCPKGHHGKGTPSDHCVPNRPWLIPVLATAGTGVGIISMLVIAFLFYWKQEERQLRKTRDKFFRQNGGLLLNEKLSGRSKVDVLKIFTSKDVENACNNYSNDNIIGRGGFGVVYKGILPNKQIVAIKKSLKVDPDQVEQFINEVLILSQIKNRYVVKLVGCCLESQVPLLVYEFINNGTLYEHLHDDVKAAILTWPIRLNIASQVANVLAYLHDVADTQIIHRDMKSMNILLDESYTAKVTDFGASRLTSSDETELATLVIGTRGYLDPEYLQSGKLTDKSDVYSFGVVLVELLTREEAVSFRRPEIERNLANHFLAKIKDGCLLNILDNNIVSEATVEQLQHVANLAKWCLNLQGDRRPTMKEAALELETIKRKGCHPWNNANDGSLEQDYYEYLLADYLTSLDDCGASTSGIESNVVYDSQLLSTLGSGR